MPTLDSPKLNAEHHVLHYLTLDYCPDKSCGQNQNCTVTFWCFFTRVRRIVLTVTKLYLVHYVPNLAGAAGQASLVLAFGIAKTWLRHSILHASNTDCLLHPYTMFQTKKPLAGLFRKHMCAGEKNRNLQFQYPDWLD